MKQLLVTIIACTTLACHAADKLSEKEIARQLAVCAKLESSRGPKLLSVVKEHAFLRAPRVFGSSVILTCIRKNDSLENPYPTEHVQALLESGVHIDQEGTGGRTALHEVAVGMSMFSSFIVEGLLKHKADPTKQDRQGYNALGIALMSGHSDDNILTLAGHPKLLAVVNQPMLVHSQMTTPLNAVIVTPTCGWRKKSIMRKLLDSGAQITVKDICDSLDPDRPYKALLNRCSFAQLEAALPLVEHQPLIHNFSKKETLCKAIKEKIDRELPALATPAIAPVIQAAQESKQPSSYEEAMQQPAFEPSSPRSLANQEQTPQVML